MTLYLINRACFIFRARAVLLLCAVVSGCALSGVSGESDALCDAQLGAPCTTIQDADGTGGAASTARTLREADADTRAETLAQDVISAGKSNTPAALAPDGGAPYYVEAYRSKEVLATAWIAPRLDGAGVFHEATFVHFVVRDAGWSDARARQGGR